MAERQGRRATRGRSEAARRRWTGGPAAAILAVTALLAVAACGAGGDAAAGEPEDAASSPGGRSDPTTTTEPPPATIAPGATMEEMEAFLDESGCTVTPDEDSSTALICERSGERIRFNRSESSLGAEVWSAAALRTTTDLDHCRLGLAGGSWSISVFLFDGPLRSTAFLEEVAGSLEAAVVTGCGDDGLGTGSSELLQELFGGFPPDCADRTVDQPWLARSTAGVSCAGDVFRCSLMPPLPSLGEELEGGDGGSDEAATEPDCNLEVTLVPAAGVDAADVGAWAADLGACQRAVVTEHWVVVETTSEDRSLLAELAPERIVEQLGGEAVEEGCG